MKKKLLKFQIFLLQLGLPDDDKLSLLNNNQTLIGSLNAFLNKEKNREFKIKENKLFFLELTTKNNKSSINGYFIITS